jgi:hypothetical protein
VAFMFSEKSDSAGQIIFYWEYGNAERCVTLLRNEEVWLQHTVQFVGHLSIFISNMRPNSTKNDF